MAVGKRERRFQKVAEYKERFRDLSTEMIRYRLNEFGSALDKEAAIALRELLEERAQHSPPPGIDADRRTEPGPASDDAGSI
jgi:hypothetical protein